MGWIDRLVNLFRPQSPERGAHAPRRIGGPTAGPKSPASALTISIDDHLRLEQTRRACYNDFDQMDREAPEAHRALDSFSDTAAQPDQQGSTLTWTFHDARVAAVVEPLLASTKLEERTWGHIRATRHLGDHFVELVWDRNGVLRRVKDLPTRRIERNVDEYGRPCEWPWKQTETNDGQGEVARFREWQIVHFGEIPAGQIYGYQRSQLSAARRPWKALELAQNSMLAERVMHTGTRLAMTVDVSGLSGDEAMEYLRAVKREYQQSRSHSTTSGQRANAFRPLAQFDDIFVPWSSGGPNEPVKVLKFGAEIGEIADVKFIYGRFLSALEVPRYELGLDEDIRSKAATNVIDAGYLRRVTRARNTYLRALVTIVNRALFVAGFESALLGDFRKLYTVEFETLQLVDEKLRWEIAKLRAEVAKIYRFDLGVVSDRFVLKHFLGVSDDEIDDVLPDVAPPETDDERAAAESLDGDPRTRLVRLLGEERAMRLFADIAEMAELKTDKATSDNIRPGGDVGRFDPNDESHAK